MKVRKRWVWPPPHFRARQIRKKKPSAILFEVKPLPAPLIQRLKKAAPLIEKKLGKMQNIDPRQDEVLLSDVPRDSTSRAGRRVRQMNIARNFPTVELAIRRTHSSNANQEVTEIRKVVQNHNRQYKNKNYFLLEPIAEAISDKLIAMPKINAPSVSEILFKHTSRGTAFFERLNKAFGVTQENLWASSHKVFSRTGSIVSVNLWLLGFKEGKLVFMAMPDVT